MPINPEAFRVHIEDWPRLFHVTSAAFLEDIRRNGLKPGSDLGRSTRNDFFQTRRGHVYLADRMTTAVVEVPGERVTLRVELVRLDPALVNSDEDLVQDSFSKPGGPWVSEPPPKRQMEDGREAPGQVGALARWAETKPGFDAPEVTAKSLVAGRIAYRGTVPPEALSVDDYPSEVAAFFVQAATAAVPDVVLTDPPLHGFYAMEIARATALAAALIDASIDTIAPGLLEPALLTHLVGHSERRLSSSGSGLELGDDALGEGVEPVGRFGVAGTESCGFGDDAAQGQPMTGWSSWPSDS